MDEFLPARSMTRIGQSVRLLRTRRGLTQEELASAAGVSRTWLNQLENGAKDNAELGALLAVLNALDASLLIRDDRSPL
ncbi:MAG: helix-turn-helix domain-containing protein [Demequina sp.]|jgi:transcriptional regulator with XRE-family HTH domain|nr:helix-turn-helix domain-containing protein [Demequina sp.]